MMLAQKLAIVTGASRGIGLAVARDLAAAGCRVLMIGRVPEAIDEAARQLRESGSDVVPHVADITEPSAVAALAARVRREFGRADILVNNAGIFLETKDFALPQAASVFAVDPEIVQATLACNALAPLRLIQAIVPIMREGGWGRIVNVSSGMGQLAEMEGFWPGYRMSKAALNALTRLTAREIEGSPIKINSVCPGWCRTDMGGPNAARSAEEGAAGIVWAALLPDDGPNGGFFRDGKPIQW
ncbi:SDR family NAD(P)-dependent oxidoreductase [Accumulibacter sp.]|uniref:SDR family NAD(P)-dependent oxidoreductase n=2 Tax=Accumulibacter sp. TaxID=2053492 RepID=UPI0028782395|nr:SDR family NAD(P)-dependent oxidoreductase [Accumulibacter sp.]MDS4056351.1 SDR family NAD(P)-dependent oxidoreductase [Accumulibacter sp.]